MLENFTINYEGGKVRHMTRDGRTYLVAPATILVEGVLNGSKGALFYPANEIKATASDWRGIPIVVYHPNDPLTNTPLSASHPGVYEKSGIGWVDSPRYVSGDTPKLKTELWVDLEKAKRVDPRVVNALTNGTPIELSTGLYTRNEPMPPGTNHRGTQYDFVAKDYKPDHLAILPDQTGACSNADGCGVLINRLLGNMENSMKCNCGSTMGCNAQGKCVACNRTPALMENEAALATTLEDGTEFDTQNTRSSFWSWLGETIGVLNKNSTHRQHKTGRYTPKVGTPSKGNIPLSATQGFSGTTVTEVTPVSSDKMTQAGDPDDHDPGSLFPEGFYGPGGARLPDSMYSSVPDDEGPDDSADGINNALEDLTANEAAELIAYNDRWPPSKRDKLPDSDFAGPNQSFPIKSQKDVESAMRLAGHADDPDAVRAKIKAIAERKGLSTDNSRDPHSLFNNDYHEDTDRTHPMMISNEFGSDDERKAAFAHMDDSDSKASSAASEASKSANRSHGSKSAEKHKTAAHLHQVAAAKHKAAGNEKMAKMHRSAAREHFKKAKSLTGNTSMNKKISVINRLIAKKLAAESDRNILMGLSLPVLNAMPAALAKAKGMKDDKEDDDKEDDDEEDGDDDDEEEVENDDDSSNIHSFDAMGPVKTGSMQAGGAGTPDEYSTVSTKPLDGVKNKKTAKWLAEAPPEIRSVVENAMRQEVQLKKQLSSRLVGNLQGERRRQTFAFMMRKPLDELKMLIGLMPAASQGPLFNHSSDFEESTSVPLFVGAGLSPLGAPTNNANGKKSEGLELPTLNFQEIAAEGIQKAIKDGTLQSHSQSA